MPGAAQIGFFVLTGIFYYLLFREFRLALPKTSLTEEQQKRFTRNILIALASWLVFMYIWSRFGAFSNFSIFPFNAAPVILIPLVTIFLFSISKTVKEIIVHIPQENIIKLQVFRFYVEVLLWAMFSASLLPIQMTFEGRNFDVVTGATATLVAWLISKGKFPRIGIVVWNILGLGLLINIVAIAILSMPTPFRVFMNEPPNTIVTEFPISLLPGFLVPLAYMLHVLSLRKAASKK